MIQPFDALPRFDLREKPFRKFERYINRALHETYELDPYVELHLKPHSFVIRFKDAILGFQRYKYTSRLFDQEANFKAIRLYELPNGWVRVVNENNNLTASDPTKLLHCERDHDKLLALVKSYHLRELDGQVFFQYSTDQQRQQWLAMQQPAGDYDITIRDFGPGTLVLRQ